MITLTDPYDIEAILEQSVTFRRFVAELLSKPDSESVLDDIKADLDKMMADYENNPGNPPVSSHKIRHIIHLKNNRGVSLGEMAALGLKPIPNGEVGLANAKKIVEKIYNL
jgi:hypothetical protein